MNSELRKLTKYVNCVADLAEQLEKDIRFADRYISDESVLRLTALAKAAEDVAKLLDDVESLDVKLN